MAVKVSFGVGRGWIWIRKAGRTLRTMGGFKRPSSAAAAAQEASRFRLPDGGLSAAGSGREGRLWRLWGRARFKSAASWAGVWRAAVEGRRADALLEGLLEGLVGSKRESERESNLGSNLGSNLAWLSSLLPGRDMAGPAAADDMSRDGRWEVPGTGTLSGAL